MPILVSACLLGENCKYSGGNNFAPGVADFVRNKDVLAVCPEMAAGLGCPRTPIELVNGVLMTRDGVNVDAPLRAAVEETVKLAKQRGVQCAVLQPRSPTCGVHQVYDGSFTGRLIPGSGALAAALQDAGVQVMEPDDLTDDKSRM